MLTFTVLVQSERKDQFSTFHSMWHKVTASCRDLDLDSCEKQDGMDIRFWWLCFVTCPLLGGGRILV